MTKEEAITRLKNMAWLYGSAEREQNIEAINMAITALSAEPIERISDNTIVVKYADYEDIGRIILTNGDIFCKMFYEDARQNDDSDYDSLVPDEYKTEPSDLISRADAVKAICNAQCELDVPHYPQCDQVKYCDEIKALLALPSAEQVTSKLKNPCDSLLIDDSAECNEQKSKLDLISRADAIEAVLGLAQLNGRVPTDSVIFQIKALPSADAKKKKAELKENGDWDCPDVGCDECDHHRSVEWCSLAIPNHEKEIDETYKMVNEAFFEGFDAAEKRYRFLIETVEELDKKLADAVQGEWEHWGSPFSDESEVIDTIVCSVCGARFIEPKDEPKGEYNYCPNCGARMKGGAK